MIRKTEVGMIGTFALAALPACLMASSASADTVSGSTSPTASARLLTITEHYQSTLTTTTDSGKTAIRRGAGRSVRKVIVNAGPSGASLQCNQFYSFPDFKRHLYNSTCLRR